MARLRQQCVGARQGACEIGGALVSLAQTHAERLRHTRALLINPAHQVEAHGYGHFCGGGGGGGALIGGVVYEGSVRFVTDG